jgi:hypothetical protein
MVALSPNKILDAPRENLRQKESSNYRFTSGTEAKGGKIVIGLERPKAKRYMSKQVDRKLSNQTTTLVRMDKGIHRRLKTIASEQGESIKALIEDAVAEILSPVPKE